MTLLVTPLQPNPFADAPRPPEPSAVLRAFYEWWLENPTNYDMTGVGLCSAVRYWGFIHQLPRALMDAAANLQMHELAEAHPDRPHFPFDAKASDYTAYSTAQLMTQNPRRVAYVQQWLAKNV